MLNKGFIGPIGDDLPSLIPLIFGLVMFFSAFTSTFTAFDSRTTEFNQDISAMKVTRIMQSNNYIYSFDNFSELCSDVGIVNLSYVAGITDQAINPSAGLPDNLFEIRFFENDSGKFFSCSNTEAGNFMELVSDYLPMETALNRKVVSRIIPIVVEDNKIVKPMHLVVIAWK